MFILPHSGDGSSSLPHGAMGKVGERYGRLVLLEQIGREKCGNARWKVRCDCGTEFEASLGNIRSGRTRSCGCLRVEILQKRGKKSYLCSPR